jgi:hypothetical protein
MDWNNQQLESAKQATLFMRCPENSLRIKKLVPSILSVLAEQSYQGSKHLPASH